MKLNLVEFKIRVIIENAILNSELFKISRNIDIFN